MSYITLYLLAIILIICSILFIIPNYYNCQNNNYEFFQYIVAKDTINYRLLSPYEYDPSKKYPLLLFLHGAGERGNDNQLQLLHGSSLFVQQEVRKKYQSFVVFPQCPKDQYWASVEQDPKNETFNYPDKHSDNLQLQNIERLINYLKRIYNIDKKRIYVGGLSMGGMGTFELVYRNPKTFAGAFSICGGAHPNIIKKIKKTPWFIYHGKLDEVVPFKDSKIIVDALKKSNAKVRFKYYEKEKHNCWDKAFSESNFLDFYKIEKQ